MGGTDGSGGSSGDQADGQLKQGGQGGGDQDASEETDDVRLDGMPRQDR